MSDLNKVMIIGRLGADPELRFTSSGAPVTTFNVAVNRKYTQDKESKESTEWFSIVAWNKQAESCNQYLVKGSMVYVEGRLHTRTWEGQDGQKHYRTEVIASQVIFLDKKQATGERQQEDEEPPSDEVPF